MSARVAVVTATRAEYGLLEPLLARLRDAEWAELALVVTGTHLEDAFGATVTEIRADGFEPAAEVPMGIAGDSPAATAAAMGRALAGLGEAYERLAPDVVVLLGDRYETLAAAAAAQLAGVPVAHIHGGEVTEGAVDDAFRHAITKIAVLHFTAAEEYRARVVQMGEDPACVFAVGALGVDNALAVEPVPLQDLAAELGFDPAAPFVLLTYHPETLAEDSGLAGLRALLAALEAAAGVTVVVTMPNADPGNAAVRGELAAFGERAGSRAVLVESLGRVRYLSLMRHAAAVVGNSSSGIIEAPAFGVPTLDVGGRQRGRLRAASVIGAPEAGDVAAALARALDPATRAECAGEPHPYGDGHAAERIEARLREALASGLSARKAFHDLPMPFGGGGAL